MVDFSFSAALDINQLQKDIELANAEASKAERQRNAASSRSAQEAKRLNAQPSVLKEKAETSSLARTAASIGKLLLGAQMAQKVFRFLASSVDEFAASSDRGRQFLEGLHKEVSAFKRSVGADVVGASQGFLGSAVKGLGNAYQKYGDLYDGGETSRALKDEQKITDQIALTKAQRAAALTVRAQEQTLNRQAADASVTAAQAAFEAKAMEINASQKSIELKRVEIGLAAQQVVMAKRAADQAKFDAYVDSQGSLASSSAQAKASRGDNYGAALDQQLADYNARLVSIDRLINLSNSQKDKLRAAAFETFTSLGAGLDRARNKAAQDAGFDLRSSVIASQASNATSLRLQADLRERMGGKPAEAAAQRIAAAKAEAQAQRAQQDNDRARKLAELDFNKGNMTQEEITRRRQTINNEFDTARKATAEGLISSVVDEISRGRDLRGLVGKVAPGDSRYAPGILYTGNVQEKMYSGQRELIGVVQQLPKLIQQIVVNTAVDPVAVFAP